MSDLGGEVNVTIVGVVSFFGILLCFAVLLIAIVAIRNAIYKSNSKVAKSEPRLPYKMMNYSYTKRRWLLTKNEQLFYKRLFRVIGKKYLIFPQIHLDQLFHFQSKGQSWRGAWKSIRYYSVDYVLCDTNFSIICAIELDDSTHNLEERRMRDEAVEAVFGGAGLPLIRVPLNSVMSDEDLERSIYNLTKQPQL